MLAKKELSISPKDQNLTQNLMSNVQLSARTAPQDSGKPSSFDIVTSMPPHAIASSAPLTSFRLGLSKLS